MKTYNEPYPTIGDFIDKKDYDFVEYRLSVSVESKDIDIFSGCFSSKDGKISSMDGDVYSRSEKVIVSDEWSNPAENIKNGLTIVVK